MTTKAPVVRSKQGKEGTVAGQTLPTAQICSLIFMVGLFVFLICLFLFVYGGEVGEEVREEWRQKEVKSISRHLTQTSQQHCEDFIINFIN